MVMLIKFAQRYIIVSYFCKAFRKGSQKRTNLHVHELVELSGSCSHYLLVGAFCPNSLG